MTKTMLQYIRKRIDALESNTQNTHAAQSGSDKDADLVQIAHRDYIDALRKCSKDESKL